MPPTWMFLAVMVATMAAIVYSSFALGVVAALQAVLTALYWWEGRGHASPVPCVHQWSLLESSVACSSYVCGSCGALYTKFLRPPATSGYAPPEVSGG